MTWPNKVYSRSMVPIYTRANDTNMLFRYKGKQRNGKYLDATGNGNDTTTNTGTSATLFGAQLVGGSARNYILSPISTGVVAVNSAYSMASLFKGAVPAGFTYSSIMGPTRGTTLSLYGGVIISSGGTISLLWYNGVSTRTASVPYVSKLPYHVIYVIDPVNDAGYLYLNSALAGSIATLDMTSPAGTEYYGFGAIGYFPAASLVSLDGYVGQNTMWNRALVAADVRKEWTQYAQMAQFKTGWGAKVSVANENTVGNYIGQGSTPFEILSGTWKVSTTTIDGELHKVLECVAAGTAWLDRCFMNINSSEAAYGGWRFRIYHAASATPTTIGFTATAKNTPAVTTGYYLRVYDTQTRLGFYNAGAYTDLTSWGTGGGATETLDIQVGRRYDGAFQYSYRRLSQPWTSTGTYTNTTYTTSEGMSINANAGDLISLGTVRDNSALIKYLGEFLPTEV